MEYHKLVLISAFVATTTFSCGSSDSDKHTDANTSEYNDISNEAITSPKSVENITQPEISSSTTSKAKFDPFNSIDNIRQKLSSVGIGNLGRWRDDEMGGFMSVTTYHQFGGGDLPNNLAYYLESDNSNSIKTLKLVLNINNGDKKAALSKFAETVDKTYKSLGMTPSNKIMSAAKAGKEFKVEKDARTEMIELEKSRIETWKFIIETK